MSGANCLQDAIRQQDVISHPRGLADPLLLLQIGECWPEVLHPRAGRGSGGKDVRAAAEPFGLPDPYVVDHRVVAQHVGESHAKALLSGRIVGIAHQFESHADMHAPQPRVGQPLAEIPLGPQNGVLIAPGVRRCARAENLAIEVPARAPAEVFGLERTHHAPVVVERRLERLAHDQLAGLVAIGAERFVVVGVKAHEIHLHLAHLVEESLEILAIPRGGTVQEVVPGQAATDFPCRLVRLWPVIGYLESNRGFRIGVAAEIANRMIDCISSPRLT